MPDVYYAEGMTDELLTHQELAAKLKVSRRTVDRLLAAGLLPARRVGSLKRFVWAEVQAALPSATVAEPIRRQAVPGGDLVAMLKNRVRQPRRIS